MTLKDKIAKARELGTRFSDRNVLGVVDALEKCLEFIEKLQKYECDNTYSPDCNGCRLHEKSYRFLQDLEPREEIAKERD